MNENGRDIENSVSMDNLKVNPGERIDEIIFRRSSRTPTAGQANEGTTHRRHRKGNRARRAISIDSFQEAFTDNAAITQAPVEQLLNYLSENIDSIDKDNSALQKLEQLTTDLINSCTDNKLVRILKDNGWHGTKYQLDGEAGSLDLQYLLLSLSNYYLHVKRMGNASTLLSDVNDGQGLEILVPFCPDVLLNYLKVQVRFPPRHYSTASSVNLKLEDVPCISFKGACMLVDISGFSKFSGAMCSKGVSGLDELRHATNGFLGHFVKMVYDFSGDVIAFAGDALICTFQDINEKSSSSPKSQISDELPPAVGNCCFRAMQCATLLKNHEASSTQTAMSLSTHIGLSYGEMRMALLGGLNDQYVYVMNGQCVSALSSCVTDAASKQVVATKECLDYAMEHMHVIHSIVPNSCSTSAHPNVLIEDSDKLKRPGDSVSSSPMAANCGTTSTKSFKNKKSSFHERAEIIHQFYLSESKMSCNGSAENLIPSPHLTASVQSDSSKSAVDQEGLDFIDIVRLPSGEYSVDNDESRKVVRTETSPAKSHLSSRHYSLVASSHAIQDKGDTDDNTQSENVNEVLVDEQSSTSLVENVAMFVPVVILAAACSGTMDNLGELRQVTTVFIELKSYDPEKHSDPRSLQPFFLMAQQCLLESGGFLRQFLVDDKGCVLIAMWGTPSFTFSNNSSRALNFAVSINLKAPQLGHICSVGVTTGTVFCGTVGAVERCDYAGVGTDVNMAARLMGKADCGVLIDRATYLSLNHEIKEMLAETYPMTLKGSPQPVTPYKYVGTAVPPIKASEDLEGKAIFLKRHVMDLVSDLIDKVSAIPVLNRSGSSITDKRSTFARMYSSQEVSFSFNKVDVLVVTGPTGSGKTVSAHFCRHTALKRGLQVISLKATSALSCIPFGVVSELLFELLPFGRKEMYAAQDYHYIRRLVGDCFPFADKGIKEYAVAELEKLLKLNVEDGEKDGENFRTLELLDRIGNTFESSDFLTIQIDDAALEDDDQSVSSDEHLPTVSSIVQQAILVLLENDPTVLIVENFHLCDELSWQLFLEIMNNTTDQNLSLSVMLTLRTVPVTEVTNSKTRVVSSVIRDDSGDGRTMSGMLVNSPKKTSSNDSANNGITSNNIDTKSLDASSSNLMDSYKELLKSPATVLHELTPLSVDEVKTVLVDALGNSVSDDLVALVVEVSAGNIYWCKSIAAFIKERGAEQFKDILDMPSLNAAAYNNPLKDLVLSRMEKLSNDVILILKYLSIMGLEFTQHMIETIMKPLSTFNVSKLKESLIILEKNGFIYQLEEDPLPIFGFQNELIRTTLYDLIPPGDASVVHCNIGFYLERHFAADLRPYYPSLAFNFGNGGKKMRHMAFKYHVKAANHAINHSAFNEGLLYCQDAVKVMEKKIEITVLNEVVDRAITYLSKLLPRVGLSRKNAQKLDLNGMIEVDRTQSSASNLNAATTGSPSQSVGRNSFYGTDHEADTRSKILAYRKIKSACESALEQFNAEDTSANKKDRRGVMKSRDSGHRLSWKLSFAFKAKASTPTSGSTPTAANNFESNTSREHDGDVTSNGSGNSTACCILS